MQDSLLELVKEVVVLLAGYGTSRIVDAVIVKYVWIDWARLMRGAITAVVLVFFVLAEVGDVKATRREAQYQKMRGNGCQFRMWEASCRNVR